MESVWSNTCKIKKRETLNGDLKAYVLIIGAGIAGILTGYLLKKSGRNPVIIDKDKMLCGNTKNTTAKITSQHHIIYSKLISEFGEEKAKHYAEANELAIKSYKDIIKEKHIDCDFEEKCAYVYSLHDIDKIKEEVKAAKQIGIEAEFVEETNLPL